MTGDSSLFSSLALLKKTWHILIPPV